MSIIIYILGIIAGIFFLIKKKYDKRAMLILITFSGLSIIMSLSTILHKEEDTMTRVGRLGKGEKSSDLDVVVEAFENGNDEPFISKNMGISVSSTDYSIDELKVMEKEMWSELMPMIKGENTSLDHVDKDLYFPSSVDGYPFYIVWNSSSLRVIHDNGQIGDEAKEEGSIVDIRANIGVEGRDLHVEEEFSVFVFPASDKTSFWRRLSEKIREEEEKSRSGNSFILPQTFEGKRITYSKKRSDDSGLIFLIGGLCCVGLIIAGKREEEKREKERLSKIESEYPEIATKMNMLVGAGLTISGAFKKITEDYEALGIKDDKPLYEELLKTSREISSGVSERVAWRNLGSRCPLPSVVRFTAMLTQYSQSGAKGLRAALYAENDNALKERRERAKRLGEEAGTKLLFPMVMMLLVVMAVIMVPAFTSFGM